MGTRDVPPRGEHTRIESPGGRVRTPARKSAPPPVPRTPVDRAEDRLDQVLGAYRLLELIGKGGMGFVYRAEHVRLGREVALKLLRADYARRRDAVSRFFQEARTVNRIRHRNIVDVTDFIELEDGTTYIIMELLRGRSLGAWAKAHAGAIDLPRALALLIQICDGLAAAHAVGVIHRDLKPDNIIIVPTPDGAEQVKLLDFGVAKLLNRDDEDIGLETAAGSVIGTPAYMSPEQAGGLVVDHRADIYSLGAIMYELFCGQPLFRGRSFGEYVRKHLNEQPVPPRETVGGAHLDPRLEAVLLRCLEKTTARRYQTVAELRDDLLHLLGGIETHEHGLDSHRVRMHAVPAGLRTPAPGASSSPGATTRPPPDPATLAALGLASSPGTHPSYPGHGSHRSQPGFLAGVPTPYPGTLPVARTSVRPWIYGAVIAALGGAVVATIAVLASGGGPGAPPAPAAAAPATPPAITPMAGEERPRLPVVEVRVDASPGAQVFALGAGVALCATPCTLSIDPADGGSTSRRDFVVRKPGFREEAFSIDLARPPTGVPIELVALAGGGSPSSSSSGDRRDRRDRGEAPPAGEPVPVEPVVAPPTTSEAPPPPTDPTPAPPPVEARVEPEVREVRTPPAPTPDPGKKPRKDPKVDPTKTIDPFAPR